MATPRLGTGTGLAALRAQAEKHGGIWPDPHRHPVRRVLSGPAPSITKPRRGDTAAIVRAAVELAEQLGPLPNALSEITTRVRRHCGQRGHPPDEELVRLLDALRERTFDLWQAVTALTLTTRPGSPTKGA